MGRGIKAPDLTIVHPLLNPLDVKSGMAPKFLSEFSIAGGTIEAGVVSKIHVHPFVDQVTLVLDGRVDVVMKDEEHPDRYALTLAPAEAALTGCGTFFQLRNPYEQACRV